MKEKIFLLIIVLLYDKDIHVKGKVQLEITWLQNILFPNYPLKANLWSGKLAKVPFEKRILSKVISFQRKHEQIWTFSKSCQMEIFSL